MFRRKPGAYAGFFQRLARIVVRRPLLVIGCWVVLATGLSVLVPPLTQVVRERTMELLPSNAPVMVATRQMTEAFHEPPSQNVALVVLTNEQGLTPADEDVYRAPVGKLRGDTANVTMVQDFITTPQLRDVMASKDNKAWFIPVGISGELGSPKFSDAYAHVAQTVRQTVAGSSLTVNMTGPAATVAELANIGERDLRVIEAATVAMVLLILLVVYRRPVTMLLPLLTIGVSLVTAQQVVAGLAGAGLGISQQTVVFMTAMMIGAGVDYAVFLISRYHEHLREGAASDEAVIRALGGIGKVIAASAATVAITFLVMTFTRLQVFSTVGPALALSIAVAFLAAVTLLPAVLALAGRRGWVAPRRELTGWFWRRSGRHIVRYPVGHLIASLVVLAALAGCAALARSSYDARTSLPPSAESNVGYAAINRHFPQSETVPQYIFVRSPHDLRNAKSLADLEQMAQRVSQLPDVEQVRGVTRPTGQPLQQATLSWQAGEVGSKLNDASSRIAGSGGDLDALTNGARQLADNLAAVHAQVSQAISGVRGLVDDLARVENQLGAAHTADQSNVERLLAKARPVLAGLNASPACTEDKQCAAARDQLQRLVDSGGTGGSGTSAPVQQLRTLLAGARQTLGALDPNRLEQQLTSMEQGAKALADGSDRVAQGVRALTDQTKQLGGGLAEASQFLLSMKDNASQPGMSGFYVPPEVMNNAQFKDMATAFVSPDGHSVRYLVQSKLKPFDTKAMDQSKEIVNTARGAQPNTSLADASISMSGITPMYSEMRDYYNHDLRFIVVMTIAIVLLILVMLLRSILAPLYLVATVVLSYLSALGVGVIAFQFVRHQPLAWSVPGMAFIVLVAVGADYNMLLISRMRDEARYGIGPAVIRTVGTTGGVITSAGLIFAASMFGMLFGSISTMVQAGFVIGAGLLIDTFLVRTVTVPALAVLAGKGNWWPSKVPLGHASHPSSETSKGGREQQAIDERTDVSTNFAPWIKQTPGSGKQPHRGGIVVFPHAGAAAASYRKLATKLAASEDTFVVQYPQRAERLNHPAPRNLHDLARGLFDAGPWHEAAPLRLFGHSMGAVVAFEFARIAEQHGVVVRKLWVSAGPVPSSIATLPELPTDGAELLADLADRGGTDPRLLADDEFAELLVNAARCDYAALNRYDCGDGVRIRADIHVVGGRDDRRVDAASLRRWAKHTDGEFTLSFFDGGHFYLDNHINTVGNRVITEI